VIPVNVKLSVEKVNIQIKCNEIDAVMDRTPLVNPGIFSYFVGESVFKIKNEGNHEARFKWTGGPNLISIHKKIAASSDEERDVEQDGFFTISPSSGCIPAKGSLEVKVSFIPGLKSVLEEILRLQVIGMSLFLIF
jgi:hypothetical protein